MVATLLPQARSFKLCISANSCQNSSDDFLDTKGSLELLRQMMGHSSVTTTERYSHLKLDLYRDTVYTTLQVDLTAPAGTVVPISAGTATIDVSRGEPARKGAESKGAPHL